MSQLSPETEQYIEMQLAAGAAGSREELLEKAIQLWKQRTEDRRYIHEAVNEGIQQAERGETSPGDEVFERLEDKAKQIASRTRS